MKKMICFLLAIVLVISIVACSKEPGVQEYITAAAGGSTASTIGDNNGAEGKNGTTEGIENTLPTGTTTSPSTGATDVTEPEHKHEYTDRVTKATCTADGYTAHICTCGESYTDSKVPATGHRYGEWKTVKEPTVAATGTAERVCTVCANKETKTLGKQIDNHTHSYSAKTAREATCSTEGVKVFTCTCGDRYTEAIAKTAHKYTTTVKKPTCTNGGFTTYTCFCGDMYSDAKISALGHSYQKSTIAPTCTAGGYTTYTCTCGDTYSGETTSALGHSYQNNVTKPTCSSGGYTTHTCSRCGSAYTDSAVGTVDHSWYAAGCETNLICSYCGAKGAFFSHNWAYGGSGGNYCRKCGVTDCEYSGHHFGADIQCQKVSCDAYDPAIVAKIDSIFAEIFTDGISEYEKVKAIHDYIINHTAYCYNCDTSASGRHDDYCYSPRGVLENGRAVCSGYAKTFQLLCEFAGIACERVSSKWLNHEWNQVRVDGTWYNIDVTWDDSRGIRYDYFLCSDQDFEGHYDWHDENGNPVVDTSLKNKKYVCVETYPRDRI